MSQKKPVEVIVFNNPEKRSKVRDAQTSGTRKRPNSQVPDGGKLSTPQTFDKKMAKYDIRKLAIGGMKKKEKDDAMIDLLVELGAKRPKNTCLHPRDYVEQLKKKREEEKEEDLKAGNIKKKKQRKPRRRNKDDLLSFVDGQKGFYKDGVQYVNSVK